MKGPKWVQGKSGKALEFASNHVSIGTFSDYTDKVTIVAWIKTPAAPAWSDIVCGPCGDIIFTLKDHKLNFAGQCANPIPHNTWSKTLLNDDKWHHVGGTYDGKQVNVYVDGQQEASNPAGGPFTTGLKSIGSNADGSGEYYNGLIDEFAIFNVALTEDDIKTIMDKGLARALGIAAVSPSGKLTATWGSIKK